MPPFGTSRVIREGGVRDLELKRANEGGANQRENR